MKNFINDNASATFKEEEGFRNFLSEREKNSRWISDLDELKADDVTFEPVWAEPLMTHTAIEAINTKNGRHFEGSDEAYEDTMWSPINGLTGSSQTMVIGGKIYRVGTSAVKGVCQRAGMTVEGWTKLRDGNPNKLSANLTNFFSETKGSLTVLVRDEKVRAVNSGRYAPCSPTNVFDWLKESFPKGQFCGGYIDHDLSTWTVDLEEYKDEIFKDFPELADYGFEPALRVITSNTGNAAVNFVPMIKMGTIETPIHTGLAAVHMAAGTFYERVGAIEDNVKRNIDAIFPASATCVKGLENLRNVQVKNAYSALLRAMKSLGLPKKQGMEAAEGFLAAYGKGSATAFDCFMSIVDAMSYVCRDFASDVKTQFEVSQKVAGRVTRINWDRLGKIPGDFSW